MSDDLVQRLQAVAQRLEDARDRIDKLEAENAHLRTAALDAICPVGERRVVDRTPQPCPAGCYNGRSGFSLPLEAHDDQREALLTCRTCGGRGTVDGDRVHGIAEVVAEGADWWAHNAGDETMLDEDEPLYRLVDLPEGQE